MRTKLLLPLLLSSLFALPALAADYYVEITNKTGYQINQMYVSPGNQKSWEEDVLGNDVLVNGTTQRVNLKGIHRRFSISSWWIQTAIPTLSGISMWKSSIWSLPLTIWID